MSCLTKIGLSKSNFFPQLKVVSLVLDSAKAMHRKL